ncbi:bifunctional DNA primase/polymerase [Nocardia sp. CY41]|uniref:bifunctional DNA primase/polymerase n=1 Tax=Nocardia sp. CY41 TaxID=2608686 RepID=UPI001F2CF7E1|nr:bifunctional DNA primase/polymerase [Nocardia sp. CY41]
MPSVSGGTSRLGPGIDIRGPGRILGGYLAGPGSIVDGREYVIEVDAPIEWLPGWLAALIGRRSQ